MTNANIRPWYQSSFMWDALSSGGVGITGTMFRAFGPDGDPLSEVQMEDSTKTWLANASIIGGSAVGGLLGYGLFGHLRDKGWGPWKAGLATGIFGGLGALAMMHAVGALTGKKFIGRLGGRSRSSSRSLPVATIPSVGLSESYLGPYIGVGATRKIEGQIVEHGTGIPINGTVVVRQGANLIGHTKSAGGMFRVYDLPAGTYKIIVTTFGGKEGAYNVTVPSSGCANLGKVWVY